MKVHTRPARMTHRPAISTREHFDWSANGDGLRELEPVEPTPSIVGTGTNWLPAMSLVLMVVLTCIGVSA